MWKIYHSRREHANNEQMKYQKEKKNIYIST